MFKYQFETEGKNPDFCLNSFLHCKPAQTKVIRLSSLNCLEARVECKLSTLTQITKVQFLGTYALLESFHIMLSLSFTTLNVTAVCFA